MLLNRFYQGLYLYIKQFQLFKQQMDQNSVQFQQQILSILKKCLPEYSQYVPAQLQIGRLCGMTNETYKISFPQHKSIVFRNLSSVINRKIEGAIIQELSRRKIAPHCFFTSMQNRVEEFIENAYHPYCTQILQKEQIYKPIIKKISQLHQIDMPNSIPRQVLADSIFTKENQQKYLYVEPHPSYDEKQFQTLKQRVLKQYENMKAWMAKNFSDKSSTIHFCHNDLNPLNLFVRNLTQNKKQAILIDFQYASFNYVAYDIANFMNQTCIEYGDDAPGFKIVKKIDIGDIKKICQHYDLKYQGIEKDIGKMLILVNYYWALWSLKTKPTPSSPNFQPLKHGTARMDLFDYYKSKYDN